MIMQLSSYVQEKVDVNVAKLLRLSIPISLFREIIL